MTREDERRCAKCGHSQREHNTKLDVMRNCASFVPKEGFGQSKSMDKRLAHTGKIPDVVELCIVIEANFNEQIDKELEHYPAQVAKRTLRRVHQELETLFAKART